ncbi:M23 family metallopeptidase [Novosphingobium sp. PS1R-30]|uniref:M23 family metallopeptidase n=1 Tax=Novosphingobium anseongense TaxID=3133436 RepID=A0ABU8RQC7_9SPHN|nr:MAG: LysM peptidoglycan-binding domain-containing protein [Novosphingobium sp.]
MKRAALLAAAAALLVAAGEPLPAERETEHVVTAGETLMGVANRAKVPRVLIIEANGLKAPYALRTGQKLKIPRTRRHTVARGDSGFTVAYRYAVPWKDIAVANGLSEDAPLKPGQVLLIPTLIATADPAPPASAASAAASAAAATAASATKIFGWPLQGTVRRGFTARTESDYHDGIDIRTPVGTAVRASAPGKVLFAGAEPRQFGNLVVIDHGNGWTSSYAFLSRVTVSENEDVRAGERIGLSGRTGMAKGPELHFELRRNNRPIDPAEELPEAK